MREVAPPRRSGAPPHGRRAHSVASVSTRAGMWSRGRPQRRRPWWWWRRRDAHRVAADGCDVRAVVARLLVGGGGLG
eukprot:4730632-Prymnesium_polylepis.1